MAIQSISGITGGLVENEDMLYAQNVHEVFVRNRYKVRKVRCLHRFYILLMVLQTSFKFRGESRVGVGLGVRIPAPHLGGPPNFKDTGWNVKRMHTIVARFST